MTAKQILNSSYAPDGSRYGAFTDGAGNLATLTTSSSVSTKQITGSTQAPDGSIYFTITNGSGTLA